jgi:hypothetical protein
LTNFLDEKRKEIDARLRELRPLVDEFHRLEKASAALAEVGNGSRQSTTRRRRGAAASSGGRRRRLLSATSGDH